jgi:uncharacterized membrane protein YcaP (DUF421 family)
MLQYNYLKNESSLQICNLIFSSSVSNPNVSIEYIIIVLIKIVLKYIKLKCIKVYIPRFSKK